MMIAYARFTESLCLKEYFLLVKMSAIQEPVPLKRVLFHQI